MFINKMEILTKIITKIRNNKFIYKNHKFSTSKMLNLTCGGNCNCADNLRVHKI